MAHTYLVPRIMLFAVVTSLVYTGANAADPIKAAPGELVSDYFGIKVADPYRRLEELKSADTDAWARSQSAHTRETLDRIPGLKALRDEINALDALRAPTIGSLKVTGSGAWFYTKRMPGENVVKLYTRASEKASERVLFDPDAIKRRTGEQQAINEFRVSPDGRHVAAIISKGDAELGEMQVISTATGAQVIPAVPGIWGESGATWTRDSRAFVYQQGGDALKPGGEPFGKTQVYLRSIAGGTDKKLMGWSEKFGPPVREKDWHAIDFGGSSGTAVSVHYEGIGSQARVYVAPTDQALRDPANVPWTPLFDTDAGIDAVEIAGGYLYGRTFHSAPRYRVLRYRLSQLDKEPKRAAEEVVPQQIGVIDGIAAAKDGLYYTVRVGSIANLYFLPHGKPSSRAQRVNLPFDGGILLIEANPAVAGVFFRIEGWAREARIMHARGTRATLTDLIPPGKGTVGHDWVAEELSCPSHDGVEVPMSVIYKRGLVKDGSHPTLMDGYGGYGVPEPAYFLRRIEPLLRRGGIYVDVKPRGGGAYGREWYQAGVGPRKSNTWKDMIACGQSLIARGFTSAGKLVIQGTSMGGVAAGMPLVERPDLFAAGIVRVGITDTLRFIEATSNGPNHENEMGTVKNAEGVKQLLAMSTYHNIKEGTAYPAILMTAGMNDNRVAAWQAFKTFARFSAASSSAKPVLLRVDFDAGHGVSTTSDQRNAELADRLAFLFWTTGDPAFQPPK